MNTKIISAGIVAAIAVVAIVIVSAFSGFPCLEKETVYGKIKTQIILEFADGSTETLMFNPIMGDLSVKYGGQELTGFYYYLTAFATGTGYQGVDIYKEDYTVDMIAKTSDGFTKNRWELVPTAENDEYWDFGNYGYGHAYIPTDGTECALMKVHVDIGDPMPSSLSPGSYKLYLNPVGQLPYMGYSSEGVWDVDWSYDGGLPDSLFINLVVESGGGLSVSYGQGWE